MKDEERTEELVVVDISRYQKIKTALKDSEARYRLLFENMSLGVFRITPDGKFVDANPALLKILGYSSLSEIACRQPKKSSDKFLETWIELCNQINRQNEFKSFDLTGHSKDNRPLFIRVNARIVSASDNNVLFYEGTVEDISERKRAEKELQILSSRNQAMLEAIPDIIMEVDANKVYTWANRAGIEFFGDDVIGKEASYYFEGEQQTYQKIQPLSDGSEDLIYIESWQRRRDGEKRLLPWWYRVLKDSSGNVTGALSSARDITELKQAESQREAALEALRRTEENFRRSLDESPLGVRIMTAEGETIYANRALLDFYDYVSVAELNQIPLRKRYTPKSYEEYKKRRKARERGRLGPSEYEVSIVRKKGEIRHLQVFRKTIFWNGTKQFQVLYRDITESKHWLEKFREFEKTIRGQKMLLDQQSLSVEELIERLTQSREDLGASYRELQAKKDDLARSEKLAFTGRIAAGIAHEIRNPLTNVILSVRQLKKTKNLKPEIQKYAEIMERNANRIEYLISELLNCARPIKLNLQSSDIHLLIQDILNVHKIRLKTQKIKVVRNLTAHPSILLIDKEQLGRVFLNLITNAIDAMRNGGKLTIDTKSEKKKFLIKIHDNGIGIPEKNLIRMFDPFFSTKKGGTGLGLSTCQNIVASHGGLIEVESTWRKGSVFSVSLPSEPKETKRKGKRESGA